MEVISIIFLIFITLLVLVALDFQLGRQYFVKHQRDRTFSRRMSDLTLITDGESLYEELFQSIQKSTHSIHILFFIVRNDEISNTFYTLLKEKAKEGVEVRLLLDFVGSFRLKRKTKAELKRSGVQVEFSRRPTFPFFFYSLQSRNHRKLAIIDGKEGYFGGFNIGKEYIGRNPNLGFWRDYHLKCEGEGVLDLQAQFLDDWFESTGEDLRNMKRYFPPLPKGRIEHHFVPTYGNRLEQHFLSFIEQAKEELYICSPYFIPSKAIMKALIQALERGVQMTIMVPIKSDHPFVKEASLPYFAPLLQRGAAIYQYDYGFYHAKVIIVDEHVCDIGTANFDQRSLYLNDEINCFIYDRSFIQLVKEAVTHDLQKAKLLTTKQLTDMRTNARFRVQLATLLAPLL